MNKIILIIRVFLTAYSSLQAFISVIQARSTILIVSVRMYEYDKNSFIDKSYFEKQLVCSMVDFYFISCSDLFLNIVHLYVMQANPENYTKSTR